ncbi:MAG: hypothetical protein ACTHYA_05535 [Ancrocorticia populi]|uniref:hypothetical protein n=1 Tax=Ancrocorticia populi TaxID=2175228 RepID=UPI003F920640
MLVSLAAASATTLADGDSLWHVPGLEEFFPEPFLFEGTPFEINRLIMVRLIAVVLLAIVLDSMPAEPGLCRGAHNPP